MRQLGIFGDISGIPRFRCWIFLPLAGSRADAADAAQADREDHSVASVHVAMLRSLCEVALALYVAVCCDFDGHANRHSGVARQLDVNGCSLSHRADQLDSATMCFDDTSR